MFVDKNFGKILKLFRVNRNIKLREVANSTTISVAQLSRFERGLSEITVDKFFHILESLNVSLEEVIYAANGFKRHEREQWLLKLRQYHIAQDLLNLRKELAIQEQKNGIFSKLNAILIKAIIFSCDDSNSVSEREISLLSDYLFGVEYWGYYEIMLLGNTCRILNINLLVTLTREMLRKSDFYLEIDRNRTKIIQLTLNCIIICIDNKKMIDATYFLKKIEEIMEEETLLYERTVYLYVSGYYDVANDVYSGFENMKKAIDIFEFTECKGLQRNFSEHFNLVKSNLQI